MKAVRRALITGINGQDGILLSDHLSKNGYEILGIGTQESKSSYLDPSVRYQKIDIRDIATFTSLVDAFTPDSIYNLASISSVARSFENPELTWEVNGYAVANILESLFGKAHHPNLKFFQASSSEMFGLAAVEPQDEEVVFHPVSPYAESKVFALESCRKYRKQSYFVASGIMYNHESIYRPKTFVTRKITSGVAAIKKGEQSTLQIGNMYAERDWGYAGDYVEAMALILHANEPDDFVISTGITHSVKDIVTIAFDEAGLGGRELEFLELDEGLLRPKEVNRLVGNSTKAYEKLGWKSQKTFEQLIREMVRYDLSVK